ncbi:hypothetical protein [Ottowia oryzae]|uniref:Uncharacterized protein n=1 Tax=Ottowia oryzae TaxID=2109914 RepID=A0A2S0MHA6_9BURK|nr:hypothetical protein [Ottowia oryzae]AVO35282.1 hypothetical protein C6570_14375 [Ottowia oryzae]
MAKCDACGTTILFGGKRMGDQRYCNDTCAGQGVLLNRVRQIPDGDVVAFANQVHSGNCPKCSGQGPVDVRDSYQVWSAILFTRWKSTPHILCRRCGVKAQAGDLAISAVAGWWGFPWGLLMTPVQVGRNIWSMAVAHNPNQPSDALLRQARLILAQRSLQDGRSQG